ncbi:DNA gyrase subunit A [candidate division KSB1 bacterium]|nr:DNA gyrase subunit A [candidate division KSB1 bacterium]RQW02582.1 MAG: DNA gyrase subunit A [candidate division KSB1 bacterium]
MTNGNGKIIPVLIEEEMKNSYIDYSMSVIVARALPDVRDGLKPVHRRVLYGMLDLGLRPNQAYKKSARIVGEVLGKYHPHGDTAVYDTMVRMAQDFTMRYPLVDGQGNFGSVDGDSPAAMRYTEARLASIAEEVLRDIEKATVDFVPNFDDSLKEPSVLPSLLPTLLVNGAAGIAVGMATNIPPHNLGEVVDALVALIARPSIKPESLFKYIQGPDFPTGAMILGTEGIKDYFRSGRGKIIVRAKAHIEEMRGGRERIVVTEIPFQVNKATLQEKVAALVREKKIDGISEVRDESDREGMRIVFELRKEVSADKVLKDLYKHTQMSTTFGVIMLALVDGQPKVLALRDVLLEFLKFRHDVVLRRTKFELDKAEKRAHILEGYIIALDNIDEVIAIIKKSRTVDTARANLRKRFKLSEIQAQAILDMRLQRLTGLERKKIEQEYRELLQLIERLKAILGSRALRMQVVKDELLELKEKYGDPRRTQIIGKKLKTSNLKDLMREEDFIVTLSQQNLIKRFSLSDFENDKSLIKPRSQKDFPRYSMVSSNSHFLLFFTNKGLCYPLRTSFVPAVNGNSEGTLLNRLISLKKDEIIVNMITVPRFEDNQYIMFGTREGQVKRILLSALSKPKEGGLEVMSLKGNDHVVDVFLTDGQRQVIIGTAHGMAIRFSEQDVRDMGLGAGGVRGVLLGKEDTVISMIPLTKKKSTIFTVTTLGFAKRSSLSDYSTIKRGGKGIITFKLTDKVGTLAGLLEVDDKEMILFLTKKGKVKRVRTKSVKVMGRATQGSPLLALAHGDAVAKVFPRPPESFKKA